MPGNGRPGNDDLTLLAYEGQAHSHLKQEINIKAPACDVQCGQCNIKAQVIYLSRVFEVTRVTGMDAY